VLDGRFEITEHISTGGQGRIYKANQLRLDRLVVLKVLNSRRIPDDAVKKRFFLEASLSARLCHPHIIQVLDYGSTDDQIYYFAMELIEGQTLEELLRQAKALPSARALVLAKQICSALIEAHGHGFVHRDLKLKNVLVTQHECERDYVKLLDFGIAKDLSADDNLTETGQIIGSPRYMAPEQISGEELDGRTDLYALGGILYTLVTGRPPFLHRDLMATLRDHVHTPVPPLNRRNRNINFPSGLEEIIQTAMRKSKAERYPNARAMYDALDACEQGLVQSSASAPKPTARPNKGPTLSSGEVTSLASPSQPIQRFMPVSSVNGFESPKSIPAAAERVRQLAPEGLVAFTDLNCPFCYALHERLSAWGLVDIFEWRLVEHASHVLDGPFGLEQEGILTEEVIAVHHRAPDVPLLLPSKRMRSTEPNRLLVYVQRLHPEKLHTFRGTLYRALWTKGLDIGETTVLRDLVEEHGLPTHLVDMVSEEPFELELWQNQWENANFDGSIPVIQNQESGNTLIGLPSEQHLIDFLLGARTMMVGSAVCHYQRRPVVVICGWISHLWQLIQDLRQCCELIQAATVEEAKQALSKGGHPDLLIIEREQVGDDGIEDLARVARQRSIHWALATKHPEPDHELKMLSMGSAEYLALVGSADVARARLARILRARFNMEQIQREALIDSVTGLPSRRQFIQRFESEWERGKAALLPLSLFLLRLDNFKAYNSEVGYLSGDTLLHDLGKALKGEVQRPGDFLARFSTDEFAVLAPSAEPGLTASLAERLAAVGADVLDTRALNTPQVSMTVGYATIVPTPDTSIHDLYESAALPPT